MSLHFRSILAAAWMCCVACPAHAAETLRLEAAVSRALDGNRALAAQSAQLRAVEVRAAHEALPPPFVLGAELQNLAGTGALAGLDGAETTLQLERAVELGGKRAARQALGQAQIARQRLNGVAARLDVEAETTARFIEVAIDQRRVEDARARFDEAQALRDRVAAWVVAARNPESDLHAAEIAVIEAQLQLEHAGHELEAARVTLAASWGQPAPDFDAVTMELEALPPLPGFEVLAARLRSTPQQRAAMLDAETGVARRRLAMAAARPDLTLGVGVRRLQALDEQALVVSMSLPLGSRRRAAPQIAEAEAQRAALEAGSDAARIESRQVLFALYQELLHARSEVEALRDRMLPQAEAALAFTRRGFEAGRFNYQALAQAGSAVTELRARQTEALARAHLRRVEIERFTADGQELLP